MFRPATPPEGTKVKSGFPDPPTSIFTLLTNLTYTHPHCNLHIKHIDSYSSISVTKSRTQIGMLRREDESNEEVKEAIEKKRGRKCNGEQGAC